MPDTDTRTAGPVLETVTGLILHCSRCNTVFQDPDDDSDAWWHNAEAVKKSFDNGHGEMYGWRRFDDRIVCRECQTTDADGNRCERPEPLPPGEENRVLHAQMRYRMEESAANPFRYAGMTTSEFLDVLDDIRGRVAEGDSFEGYVEYVIPEKPRDGVTFDVRAGYRVGNSMGQGGFRLIEGSEEAL
jgi:hypothetical protein